MKAFAMAGLAVPGVWLIYWLAAGVPAGKVKLTNPHTIEISAARIAFDQNKLDKTRFGKLEWLGTLRLTSPSPHFGGYSGLALDKTGTRLFAISDAGSWLKAEIVYRDGRMQRLGDARIGALRGLDGKRLSRERDSWTRNQSHSPRQAL